MLLLPALTPDRGVWLENCVCVQMLHCGCVIANGQMLRHHQSAACAGHAHLTGDDYVLRAAKVYLRSLGSELLLDASTCDEVLRSVTLYVLSYTGHRKLPHYLNQDGYYLSSSVMSRARCVCRSCSTCFRSCRRRRVQLRPKSLICMLSRHPTSTRLSSSNRLA